MVKIGNEGFNMGFDPFDFAQGMALAGLCRNAGKPPEGSNPERLPNLRIKTDQRRTFSDKSIVVAG